MGSNKTPRTSEGKTLRPAERSATLGLVIAFHGQFSSGKRMRFDMGDPHWVDWYPDWQRDYRDAEHFSQTLLAADQPRRLIVVGYSLGGDFIARLTHEWISDRFVGIVVYESPLKSVDLPKSLPCPVVQVWNNYTPRGRRRRAGKAKSINGWDRQYESSLTLVGSYTRHVVWQPNSPFRPQIGQAWDQGLNPWLGDWVEERLAA